MLLFLAVRRTIALPHPHFAGRRSFDFVAPGSPAPWRLSVSRRLVLDSAPPLAVRSTLCSPRRHLSRAWHARRRTALPSGRRDGVVACRPWQVLRWADQ